MCDTIIATRKMTLDGFTIFGKNSDRVCNEPQYFVFVPATDHSTGKKVHCTYIDVEQVTHTNSMILSKPSWIWGAEMGVNEFGVLIGNESVFSKEIKKEPALLGMDIIRLALERAKTAREAVEVMTEMLEKYGQGGNASFDDYFYYDNAYIVTDAFESWHLETAGDYWAVKQIEGSYTISNHMIMGTPDFMHKDALQHAIESGYPIFEPFDFTSAYIDWENPSNVSGIIRGASSLRMIKNAGKRVTMTDMLNILRSHTTEKKWTLGDRSVCKHGSEKSSSITTNSMLAICKPGDMIFWGTGMSTPCIAPYQPFWMDAFSDKLVFSYDKQQEAMDSWLKREQINRAVIDGRLYECEDEYIAELKSMESSWIKQVDTVARNDRQALCDKIANEADTFINKWLKLVEKKPSNPIGSEAFRAFWHNKNSMLGKNRKIAF